MRAGRYWMRLSRFFTIAASRRGVPQVRGVGRHLDDGQPVPVRLQQRAHHAADVRVQVVPAKDDRGMKLGVRGGDQAGVVSFGHRAALALAPGVDAGPVEEPAAGTRPKAGHSCHGHPPGAFPGHQHHRGMAAVGPGAGLRRAQGLAGLVLEAEVRPGRRR